MEKINFEDGQLVKGAHVIIDGVEHEIIEAEYEGDTPLSAFVLNKLQDNVETEINTHIEHKYILKIASDITAGTAFTIPCNYKVGANVLDVYLNGERLILSSDDSGTDGHYCEVGETDSTSNQIKTTTDWSLKSGDALEFVVRGEYV